METTKKNIESANTVNNATAETMPTAVTGKEVAPSGTPPTPKSEKKGKETKPKSETQRKAEELQKELERKQKELDDCLKELERKKKLSAHRTIFLETLDKVDIAEECLNEVNDFEVGNYRLTFAKGNSSYNSEAIFFISNRELLLNFVDFIREKINKKIAEIETELVK